MDDDIDEVQQDPARFGLAFNAARPVIVLCLQPFHDVVDDGLELALAGAGTDDEVIDVGR